MNEILIYGDIGFEVHSREIASQLRDANGPVTVRVNSYGGDIYEGISIMNALRSYPDQVRVIVEGVAASAASIIAIGGAERTEVCPGAEVMVHMPWVETPGDADELRKTADDLDRTAQSLAEIYAEKAGGTAEQWLDMMRAETWFSAQEAVDAGVADAVVDARAGKSPVLAGASRKRFAFAGRSEAPTPKILKEENMAFTSEVAKRLGLSADVVDEATVLAALEETLAEQAEGEERSELETAQEALQEKTAKFGEEQREVNSASEEEQRANSDAEEDQAAGAENTTGESAEVEEKPAEFAEEPAEDSDETEVVTLPRDVFEELQAAAAAGAQARETERVNGLDAEVDQWIAEGRAVAANRAAIRKAMHADPEATRRIYQSVPKGTIPRAEIGYGVDPVEPESDSMPSVEELRERAKSRLASGRK